MGSAPGIAAAGVAFASTAALAERRADFATL